ncbi:MAG: hypothetical protein FRX49_10561 [Trebouxia sp. A1-2]|nr:MAG: hypothetical protein FRX49_10561 [Trebouxia sp. A1-2]
MYPELDKLLALNVGGDQHLVNHAALTLTQTAADITLAFGQDVPETRVPGGAMPSSSSLSYVPLFMLVVISRRGRSMISCIKLPCFFSSALYDLHGPTTVKNALPSSKTGNRLKQLQQINRQPASQQPEERGMERDDGGAHPKDHGWMDLTVREVGGAGHLGVVPGIAQAPGDGVLIDSMGNVDVFAPVHTALHIVAHILLQFPEQQAEQAG